MMEGLGFTKSKFISNIICRNCHNVWPIEVETFKPGKNRYWACGTCGKWHQIIKSKRQVPFQTKTTILGKGLLPVEAWVKWDFNTGKIIGTQEKMFEGVPEWTAEYEPK